MPAPDISAARRAARESLEDARVVRGSPMSKYEGRMRVRENILAHTVLALADEVERLQGRNLTALLVGLPIMKCAAVPRGQVWMNAEDLGDPKMEASKFLIDDDALAARDGGEEKP